jgi:hypothetical protein
VLIDQSAYKESDHILEVMNQAQPPKPDDQNSVDDKMQELSRANERLSYMEYVIYPNSVSPKLLLTAKE